LVSERDIVAALADGADPDRTTVELVMTGDLITVQPGDELIDAVHAMLDAGVRHLPLTDGGVVVGMVSARDALRAFTAEAESTTT
jgi:CBS domain-containing protein